MSKFTGNTFVNQRIDLDDNIFDGNKFQNCTLVYGGGPLTFNNNSLHDVNWEFVGAAGNTLAILKLLYETDGFPQDFMEAILSSQQTEAEKKEGENGKF